MMTIRALHREEEQQLKIAELFHQKRLNKGFNWFTFGCWILLIVASIGVIIYYDESWMGLLSKFAVGIIPICLWVWIMSFRGEKRESRALLQQVSEIKAAGTVAVRTFNCTHAIRFGDPEDLGVWYAFEIDKRHLLFFLTYYDEGFLPNTKLEIYEHDSVYSVTGRNFNALGAMFQPINIPGAITKELWDDFPEHGQVIEATVESYLDEIADKLR